MSSDTSNDQSTLDDLIQKASNFLQKGNTEQAEAIYLQILSLEPGHADSLHMVGLLRFQSGTLKMHYISSMKQSLLTLQYPIFTTTSL